MSKLTIYHNPRCTKSRQGLAYLTEQGVKPEVREYLNDPLTEEELRALLAQLNIPASALVRRGEDIYKAQFKGREMSEASWIKAMVEFPKLMERPIVSDGQKAVVGRPTEKIGELL